KLNLFHSYDKESSSISSPKIKIPSKSRELGNGINIDLDFTSPSSSFSSPSSLSSLPRFCFFDPSSPPIPSMLSAPSPTLGLYDTSHPRSSSGSFFSHPLPPSVESLPIRYSYPWVRLCVYDFVCGGDELRKAGQRRRGDKSLDETDITLKSKHSSSVSSSVTSVSPAPSRSESNNLTLHCVGGMFGIAESDFNMESLIKNSLKEYPHLNKRVTNRADNVSVADISHLYPSTSNYLSLGHCATGLSTFKLFIPLSSLPRGVSPQLLHTCVCTMSVLGYGDSFYSFDPTPTSGRMGKARDRKKRGEVSPFSIPVALLGTRILKSKDISGNLSSSFIRPNLSEDASKKKKFVTKLNAFTADFKSVHSVNKTSLTWKSENEYDRSGMDIMSLLSKYQSSGICELSVATLNIHRYSLCKHRKHMEAERMKQVSILKKRAGDGFDPSSHSKGSEWAHLAYVKHSHSMFVSLSITRSFIPFSRRFLALKTISGGEKVFHHLFSPSLSPSFTFNSGPCSGKFSSICAKRGERAVLSHPAMKDLSLLGGNTESIQFFFYAKNMFQFIFQFLRQVHNHLQRQIVLNVLASTISQFATIPHAATPGSFLIFQGPCGTGKTTTLALSVCAMTSVLHATSNKTIIMCCAASNTATDELCEKIGDMMARNLISSTSDTGWRGIKKKFTTNQKVLGKEIKIIRIVASMKDKENDTSEPHGIESEPYYYRYSKKNPNIAYVEHQYAKTILKEFEVDVVCTTLMSSAHPSLEFLESRVGIVCIDEAPQSLEPDILIPIVKYDPRLVICSGDHHQLGPIFADNNEKIVKHTQCNVSIFERLFNITNCVVLRTQHRFNSDICNIVSELFYSQTPLLRGKDVGDTVPLLLCGSAHGTGPNRVTLFQYLTGHGMNLQMPRALCYLPPCELINVDGKEERKGSDPSYYNKKEAQTVIDLLLLIIEQIIISMHDAMFCRYINMAKMCKKKKQKGIHFAIVQASKLHSSSSSSRIHSSAMSSIHKDGRERLEDIPLNMVDKEAFVRKESDGTLIKMLKDFFPTIGVITFYQGQVKELRQLYKDVIIPHVQDLFMALFQLYIPLGHPKSETIFSSSFLKLPRNFLSILKTGVIMKQTFSHGSKVDNHPIFKRPFPSRIWTGSKALSHALHRALFSKIKISTVDAFQGSERDIVLLSTVRTNSEGFLGEWRRINVGISRARHSLLIVGNKRASSKVWESRRIAPEKTSFCLELAYPFSASIFRFSSSIVVEKEGTSTLKVSPPTIQIVSVTIGSRQHIADEDPLSESIWILIFPRHAVHSIIHTIPTSSYEHPWKHLNVISLILLSFDHSYPLCDSFSIVHVDHRRFELM
ncbi:DNA2/NAM7-like helicase like protein, partial [Aduncisulcus paluster]